MKHTVSKSIARDEVVIVKVGERSAYYGGCLLIRIWDIAQCMQATALEGDFACCKIQQTLLLGDQEPTPADGSCRAVPFYTYIGDSGDVACSRDFRETHILLTDAIPGKPRAVDRSLNRSFCRVVLKLLHSHHMEAIMSGRKHTEIERLPVHSLLFVRSIPTMRLLDSRPASLNDC